MGRPSHLGPAVLGTLRPFAVIILYLMCQFIAISAQDNSNGFADVRSGRIPLRKASDAANDAASGGAGVPSSVPHGKDKDNRQLFVLQYNEDTVLQLHKALLAGGADIIDIVADNALLVLAKPNVIGTADRFGALAALFQPAFKVAPEAAAISAAATASASGSKAQRSQAHGRRRGRRLAAPGGGANASPVPGSSAGLGARDKSSSSESSGLGPLAAVSTWRGRQEAFQADDPPSAVPPSPPPSQNNRPSPGPSPSSGSPPSSAAVTESDMYGVSVRLVPGLSEGARSVIAQSWPAALATALGLAAPGEPCRPQAATQGLFSETSPLLLTYFCAKDYEAGVAWLSKLATVLWIEPALKPRIRNAMAGWIMQTGNLTMSQLQNPTGTLRPYWSANLQGQGVVVGIEDTGIDMDHCHFIDDRYRQGSLRTMFVGSPPRLYLPDHRKVVQYVLPIASGINRWFGDQPYGHGTHTASSIAGAAYVNSSMDGLINQRSTGSAPQARLSFYDISPDGRVFLPNPIDDKMLSYHYAVGARISSSSWGFDGAVSVTYNEACRQFDAFAWRNPEFLSVIAAGNDGDNTGMVTVTAPATAKNILSVGATVNHPKDYAASPYNLAILFRYTDANGTRQSQAMYPYRGTSEFVWRSLLNNKEVPLYVASPLNACTRPSGNYTGAIVLVDLFAPTLNCTVDMRATNARSAGAAAVLFIAATYDFLYNVDAPYISDPRLTWGIITRAQGLATASLLRNTTRNITNPHMIFLTYPNINVGIDSLTYFSSNGPFTDGRFKPDIVAPGGTVESAASSSGIQPDTTGTTCSSSTIQYQGTSMAAPLVAGHLALMRQYFRDGYYPTGTPSDPAAAGFEPSGMLLKAAAIAGASSLMGGFATNLGANLGAAPDGYQGWGRLDMSRTLPLPGQSHPFFRVAVADFGVIEQSQWIYLSGIRATGTGPIFAALVWHDYPGSGAARKNLINDLDFGYQINTSSILKTRADTVNNVERIELLSPRAGDRLTFSVYGRTVRHQLITAADAALPQRWAVLVVGHFNGTLRTPLNPAYTRPERYTAETNVTLRLPSGCVTVGKNDTIVTNGACNISASVFTLVEELAPVDSSAGPKLASDSGYLYTVRDSGGRCLTVPGGAYGARVVLAPCNASDATQKIGLFKRPYVDGSSYQFVLSSALRATAASAGRCLKQTAISILLLFSCDDEDASQFFELRSAAVAGRAGRTIEPSPPPPLPSPQAPAQQWYPYGLTFRADWYPVGVYNPNDYDYRSDHNGYGDYSYGPALDDLDIIVSWMWNGTSYTLGPSSDDMTKNFTGAMYGGDNTYVGTQYEIVYFKLGVVPPPTSFHVCVAWKYTQTASVRVVMTVFQGYAVASSSKLFDTNTQADFTCSPSARGYVGTYDPAAPSPPPSPPTPQPPPLSSYALMFRMDWSIISGVRGRAPKLYNFDIIVSWNVGNQTFVVGSYALSAGGALYGGDNMYNNGSNFETVYWPAGASLPPTNTFHACVRWFGNTKPLALVTLSVFQNGRVTTSSKTIDTTFDYSDTCAPGQMGYIDSYWVGATMGLPDDLSYSSCFSTPAPSPAFSLYFLASWTSANGALVPAQTLLDWDLVVAWRWGDQTYELSPYSRFVSGGVHGGDNMRLVVRANSEAVYWPTGLTGVEPNPTQYDVCVRWFSAGRLNVTLTAYLYNTVVMRTNKTLDGSAVNSKTCTTASGGYLGSYTYRGPGGVASGFVGRRALELPGEDDGSAAVAGLLDPDQLAALLT